MLGAGVALWIAGFDVIYAFMDITVDRAQGLHSIPADLGERAGLWSTRVFHVLAIAPARADRVGPGNELRLLSGSGRLRAPSLLRELAHAQGRPGEGGRGLHDHERHHQRGLLCSSRPWPLRAVSASTTGVDASPEPGKIRQMFDGIAGSYDRLNDLMTAGLHHRWRDMGVMLAGVGPGFGALDVCCGTGDFAFALKRAVGPEGRVVGVDVSEEMLQGRPGEVRPQPALRGVPHRRRARPALPGRGAARAGWGSATEAVAGPAGRAPVRAGAGFDACTVGFGIRNVHRHHAGLQRDAPGVPSRGQGGLPRDHAGAASRSSSSSTTSGSTTPYPVWASSPPGTSPPTATSPRRSSASPIPTSSRG